MDLIDIQIEENGQIFRVQERMSFVQQNKLMELIEDYIDFTKFELIQEDIKNETLTIEKFSKVLQKGIKLTSFNFGLTMFCLTNFVREPKITEAMLDDPDDPNVANYAVLGVKLVEIAIEIIGQRALLKKTPTKS